MKDFKLGCFRKMGLLIVLQFFVVQHALWAMEKQVVEPKILSEDVIETIPFNRVPELRDHQRLSIFIDPEKIELEGFNEPITWMFSVALHQEASAIIVQASILQNYLKHKLNMYDVLGGEKDDDSHDAIVLPNFDANNWDIFSIKQSRFLLLLPKNKKYGQLNQSITIDGRDFEIPLYRDDKTQKINAWRCFTYDKKNKCYKQ